MDTALKQRLIGAVVLVALAVIFLPMLIKGPAPDSGVADVPLDVPPMPAGDYETRELPLVTPGTAPQGGAVGLGGGTAPAAVSGADDAQAPGPDEGGMLPPATAGGDYAVNFGAYATSADADAVIARLRQAGLPGFREPATIGGKAAHRVRIGPYADRASAEAVRLQAARVRSDVNAQVVVLNAAGAPPASTPQPAAPAATVASESLPPEPAQPAPETRPEPRPEPKPSQPAQAAAPTPPPAPATPAAAGVGFAVQLGAFSRAADAEALRDKLRAGGFSAFVEQVRTDKGTLNRVRVGPVSSRGDADQLKAQVAAKAGMGGMVVSHP
jgi:cell division septation protein DedD